MSHELRIEKEKAEVTVMTLGGRRLSGEVFVQPYHPLRAGRERPSDVLNGPEQYFPLEVGGDVMIVAKDAVAALEYVTGDSEDSAGSLPIGVNVTLNVTLSGGKEYAGSVWVEGPVNTPRLLDFMNRSRHGERFLELRADGRVLLLNRAHIETLRAED